MKAWFPLVEKIEKRKRHKYRKEYYRSDKNRFFQAAARLIKTAFSSAEDAGGARRAFLKEDEDNKPDRDDELKK